VNRTEQMILEKSVDALRERVTALEHALFGKPGEEPAPEAKVEGAEVPDPAAHPGHSEPVQQGIVDKQGGWFDAYYQGRKINRKALRKGEAEALVNEHVAQAAMAEAAE
jgi:hypothetical protein